MTCDSLMLRRMVVELQALAGLRVERVFPVGRLELALGLRTRHPGGQIVISGNPDAPRLHRTDECEPLPGADTPLSDVARRHLRGATFTGAEQLAFDRVVTLRFANCEGLGPQSRRSLVVEISGRHTNLLLLDEEQTILECARHVTARVNRVRQSLPGEPYAPPPDFDKLDPQALTAEALQARLPPDSPPLAKWLREHLQGGSEVFLAVLAERCGSPTEATTAVLAGAGLDRLVTEVASLLAEAGQAGPGYIAVPPGGKPVAYPVPPPAFWQQLAELPNLSAAWEVVHRRSREGHATEQLRQRLTGCLHAAGDKARRRETARAEALRHAGDAARLRHHGELLLSHLHQLSAGQAEAEVLDWQTGEALTLPLDPRLTPQENAQRYFGRYKKQQRVRDQVPPLLAAARAEREDYEDLLDQVPEANLEELRLLEEELRQRGLLPPGKRAGPPVKADHRRSQTSDGYAVLYGRSGLENAAVLREARPDDLWFHVQGAPGGHVVLRTDNRPEAVPQSTLLEAARLAARQSLRRREATVAVDYTLVKHLTRTRGAAPGHVVYREARTLLVRPRD
jgi:predicted ribosome quality control (RQC) complex YloA/Tae2 family protein